MVNKIVIERSYGNQMKNMHILGFIMKIILSATGERWIWNLEDKVCKPVDTELYSVFTEESTD